LGNCLLKKKFIPQYRVYEWLTNNNINSYIDTGYIPSTSTRVISRIQNFPSSISGGNGKTWWAWGARKAAATDAIGFASSMDQNQYNWHGIWPYRSDTGTNTSSYNNSIIWWNGVSSTRDNGPYVPSTQSEMIVDDNKGNWTITIGNNVYSWYNDLSSRISPNCSLYLFTMNTNGTPFNNGIFRQFQLGYVKIYTNGTLVRDFLPAYDMINSRYGMYDFIDKKFYKSSNSSGSFTAYNYQYTIFKR